MPKKRLLLFLFVILSLSVMTYQSNRQHFLPFKFLNGVFNKVHDAKNAVKEFVSSPFRKMLLREQENARLKQEISLLMQKQQKCQEALSENQRLREILALREKEPKYVTGARVISRNTDQWSNTLVLDKGSADGVKKDMSVVTEKGLVGKIAGVSGSYSYLLLLSDINFSVSARLQESRAEGVVSGTGFRKCRLKYLPFEDEVKIGSAVITSGLDMLFPPGIPIGYVTKVNKKGVGFFQDIEVLPFADGNKVEVVAIIKKE